HFRHGTWVLFSLGLIDRLNSSLLSAPLLLLGWPLSLLSGLLLGLLRWLLGFFWTAVSKMSGLMTIIANNLANATLSAMESSKSGAWWNLLWPRTGPPVSLGAFSLPLLVLRWLGNSWWNWWICRWLGRGKWLKKILPPNAGVNLLGDRNGTSVGLNSVTYNVVTDCWEKPVSEMLCPLCLCTHQVRNKGSESSEFSLVLINRTSTLFERQELTLYLCSVVRGIILLTNQLLEPVPSTTFIFTGTHTPVSIPPES
ncbi:Unknown protein, partial [Striga hermonthica]